MRRTALLFFGFAALVVGAVLLAIDMSQRQDESIATEARLDPAAPAMRDIDVRSARRGERLGRVRIHSIGVDEALVEGVSGRELAVALGRYPSSQAIGVPGVLAIAGHRTGWGNPLLRADELDRGERIVVRAGDRRYVYEVTRSIIVGPDDHWVLRGDPRSDASHRLVLTTCDPPYTDRDRLIVWADLVTSA